jgi:hypothetical protein
MWRVATERAEQSRATERVGRCLMWAWLNFRSTVMRETSFGRFNIWNVWLGSRGDTTSLEGNY